MIIIVFVALLLFGGEKLPQFMRGIGKGFGELQKGLEDGKQKLHDAMHHDDTNKP